MSSTEIRWIQCLRNFEKALSQLADGVEISRRRSLNDLEKQGLIQAFEFTHELAWNLIRDYFRHQGNTSITGSRDATREAFKAGLIDDGESWMEMIRSRNLSSHTYNRATVEQIVELVRARYLDRFLALRDRMRERAAANHE